MIKYCQSMRGNIWASGISSEGRLQKKCESEECFKIIETIEDLISHSKLVMWKSELKLKELTWMRYIWVFLAGIFQEDVVDGSSVHLAFYKSYILCEICVLIWGYFSFVTVTLLFRRKTDCPFKIQIVHHGDKIPRLFEKHQTFSLCVDHYNLCSMVHYSGAEKSFILQANKGPVAFFFFLICTGIVNPECNLKQLFTSWVPRSWEALDYSASDRSCHQKKKKKNSEWAP